MEIKLSELLFLAAVQASRGGCITIRSHLREVLKKDYGLTVGTYAIGNQAMTWLIENIGWSECMLDFTPMWNGGAFMSKESRAQMVTLFLLGHEIALEQE